MAFDTGAYLTRFEDFLSNDSVSGEEGGDKGAGDVKVLADTSSYYQNSLSEEAEDVQLQRNIPKKKPDTGAEITENPVKKVFSSDYADLCKYSCPVCGEDIETDKLRTHFPSSHNMANNHLNQFDFSTKTWHRCGLCQKEILFTRMKLRHHVVSEHAITIADYSKRFMMKETPSQVVEEEQLTNDYADILKTRCKICNKIVETDNFR